MQLPPLRCGMTRFEVGLGNVREAAVVCLGYGYV